MEPSYEPTLTLLTLASHLPLRVRPASPLDDDALFELCQLNRDLRIERTRDGELVVRPPTGGDSGRRNFELIVQLGAWAAGDGTGVGFDSSTGFILPNGAERSPDAAWIRNERWEALPAAARRKFPPLAPDFVVELKSPSDALDELHSKMREYIENGVALGWLIDPESRVVWIYRPGGAVERLEAPETVSGDPMLPGLRLRTARIW